MKEKMERKKSMFIKTGSWTGGETLVIMARAIKGRWRDRTQTTLRVRD